MHRFTYKHISGDMKEEDVLEWGEQSVKHPVYDESENVQIGEVEVIVQYPRVVKRHFDFEDYDDLWYDLEEFVQREYHKED